MKRARIYLKLFTPFIYNSKTCYIIYNNNDHEFIMSYSTIMKRITIYCNIVNMDFNISILTKHKKWYKLKADYCEEDNACYLYNLFLILELWKLKSIKSINQLKIFT